MTINKLVAGVKAGLAAITLLFTLKGQETKAQQTHQSQRSNDVVARLIRYDVKSGFLLPMHRAISEYVIHSLDVESNILSEAYYEQDKPSVLWIIERWTSKKALEEVSRSAQFTSLDSLSQIALIRPQEFLYVKDLEPLSKQQWRNIAGKVDKPVTVMLFVDSRVGTENTFRKVYHTAMPQFRSEPGVINYQLSQFEKDSTRFVTYEKFRSEAAFQYHLNFPPIKPVIDYLHTSIKQQPFEAGIRKLIAFASIIP